MIKGFKPVSQPTPEAHEKRSAGTLFKTIAGVLALSVSGLGAWKAFSPQTPAPAKSTDLTPTREAERQPSAVEFKSVEPVAATAPGSAPSANTAQPTQPAPKAVGTSSKSNTPESKASYAPAYSGYPGDWGGGFARRGVSSFRPTARGLAGLKQSKSLKNFRASIRDRKNLKKTRYASGSQMRAARNRTQARFSEANSALFVPSGASAPMAPREQLAVLLTLSASQGPGYLAAPVFTQLIQNAAHQSGSGAGGGASSSGESSGETSGLTACQLSALGALISTPSEGHSDPEFEALMAQHCSLEEGGGADSPMEILSKTEPCNQPSEALCSPYLSELLQSALAEIAGAEAGPEE